MSEKIKIKATLHDGDTYTVRGTSVVNALATFISNRLNKEEVDRLQGILKVTEASKQYLNKICSNPAKTAKNSVYEVDRKLGVVAPPTTAPEPSSNAVLAERIVELDRRLSQYMDVGKSHVESINGLIDEVSRLRGENTSLIQRNDSLRAAVENRDVSVRSYHAKIEGMTGDLATYEKRHAAMQAKVLDLQEENRVMDNLIAVKQKDLAHYTEVIADLKHICSGYSGKIDALEKQVALQSSHAASLENQLVDRVRALDIQSSNVASLNRKYSSVRQYLVNFRDAFNRYTGSVDGSEFQRNAVANLQNLLAMYPEIVETDSDKTTSAVEWQAPAERGTEGY